MEFQNNSPINPSNSDGFQPIEQPRQGWFKRHRKITYFLLLPVSVLILLVILYFAMPTILHYVAGQDDALTNDQDLRMSKVSILDSENAYFDLIKLSSMKITEPQGLSSIDIVNGKGWDQSLVEQALEENKEPLDIFSAAAEKSKYQDPKNADPAEFKLNGELTPLNSWRTVARLSVIKSELLSREGKGGEAMDEGLKSVEVGHIVQNSQGTLINYLAGTAIKNYGLEIIQQNLRYREFTTEELNRYSQILENYRENGVGLKNAFKGEYLKQVTAIDAVRDSKLYNEIYGDESPIEGYEGKTYNHYLFKPNQTKNVFAILTRSQIQQIDQKVCIGKSDFKLLAPSTDNFIDVIKLPFTENVIGKILHDVIWVSLDSVFTKRCEQDTLLSIIQLNIALKKYANANAGAYPNSLNDLMPTYISYIPKDPFDNKTLKYSRSKGIIYSVGEDLTDSGGSNITVGTDWTQNPDLSFRFIE